MDLTHVRLKLAFHLDISIHYSHHDSVPSSLAGHGSVEGSEV